MKKIIIDEEYAGVRFDRFARKILVNFSLTDIFKAIRVGKIKVNGKKCKQDYRLKEGDEINFFIDFKIEKQNLSILNKNIKNKLKNMIVFEDENLFICNKPDNISVHAGTNSSENLLDLFRGYYNSENINFVNRIDKTTSGLLIGAKNIKTARALSEIIRNNGVTKKYYILVRGNIKTNEFTIENYLKKGDSSVLLSEVEREGYKKSVSKFYKLDSNEKYSLLEAELITGRTHQLRVQLADIGHPIVGDKKYNKYEKSNKMYLFSHFLSIDLMNIEINLDVPEYFTKKFNS